MKKGTITIYLAFIFTIILSLLLMIITAARDSAIRFKAECSMDAAIYSVFAEYNRELLERYDLLFIDSSYGGGQGKIANTEAHLLSYMNKNFDILGSSNIGSVKDLLQLNATGSFLLEYRLASDQGGKVLERQACDYIKQKYGTNSVALIKDLCQTAKDSGYFTEDVEAKASANQAEINSIELPKKQISDEQWEEIPLENPADGVNGTKSIGVLGMVLDPDKELSGTHINASNYISNRNCNVGIGLKANEQSQINTLLFDKYIMEKSNCYTSKENDGLLKYQTEYIIAGNDNDPDNLKAVIEKLLFVREAANLQYLISDGAKMAEAEALAASLAAVSAQPLLLEPVKWSIVLAWTYAESMYDVSHLLAGGKIPLLKDAITWHYSLSAMLHFQSELTSEVSDTEQGLKYEDYLSIFLVMTSQDAKCKRMMDIIEMDVRQSEGNRQFRLDSCVDYLMACVTVESRFGYGCEITRDYKYF